MVRQIMVKENNLRRELENDAKKLHQEIEASKAFIKQSRARLAKIEKQIARMKAGAK